MSFKQMVMPSEQRLAATYPSLIEDLLLGQNSPSVYSISYINDLIHYLRQDPLINPSGPSLIYVNT